MSSLFTVRGLWNDFFQLLWASLYWNFRKALFRQNPKHRDCPCQVASDSGKARETGCEATLGLSQPSRLRIVCPALVLVAGRGWVCGVDREEVRPFWVRAIFGWSAILGLSALIGVALLWGGLHSLGYPITVRQLVWPPAWGEFRQVQAEMFRGRARSAQALGRRAEALLHLTYAHELDPRHFETAFALATIWQVTQPVRSDETFARLLHEFPERAVEVAPAWFRALLVRGDWLGVQRLSGERLRKEAEDSAAPWAQGFLRSSRVLGEPEGLRVLLADADLGLGWRQIVERELWLVTTRSAAARVAKLRLWVAEGEGQASERKVGDASPRAFASYYWRRQLLEEGDFGWLAENLRAGSRDLGVRERLRLQLDLWGAEGRVEERRAVFAQLSATLAENPAAVELVSSHLVEFPQVALARLWSEMVLATSWGQDEALAPRLLALYLGAVVAGDAKLRQEVGREVLGGRLGREVRSLELIEQVALRSAETRQPELLIFLQPLPLETLYAYHAGLSSRR